MISSNTHIIRQQVIDITYTGTTTEGVSLQQKMTALCTGEIIPVLEKVLNQFNHIRGHVYIDLLEIDLGIFQPDDLEYELTVAFKEKLEFLLAEPALQNLITAHDKVDQITDDRFRYTDDITSFAEAIIHFLQTGRLPWMFRLPPDKSLNQVFNEILKGPEHDRILYKIRESLRHPKDVRRMVLQFDEIVVLEILNFISPVHAMIVERLLDVFSSPYYAAFRQTILEAAFFGITLENTNQTEEEIFDLAVGLFRSDPGAQPKIRTEHIIAQARKHQISFKPKVMRKGHSIEDKAIAPRSSHPIFPIDTTGLYIDNAGLILLHPFLPALFEGIGLLKEDTIVDSNRALFLLHYLCTGQKEAPEYDLTFSKIICGIPVDEPVSRHITLAQEEIQEADTLLSAVIRHWSVLQHTSHEGLRGTFLLRHGKLSTAFDGGWLLQVERQSVDILLDSLPWGFGIVKLPWLSQHIHVEW